VERAIHRMDEKYRVLAFAFLSLRERARVRVK
jgi:hypothetical protein